MSTAKLGIDVTGGRAGVAQLEDLKRGLREVGEQAQKTSVQLLAAMKRWEDPLNAKEWSRSQKLAAEGVKLIGSLVGSQATALASAVAGPAKTTYDQALARAHTFRGENTRIALSVGKSYKETSAQIFGTAKQIGAMPAQVANYGNSVRQLTGNWHGAMAGIEGYQSRALKTGRQLDQMIPTVATLTQAFGIESTNDVNKFFDTLDTQAKRAKVSAEVAERAFVSAAGMLSSITSAKPQALTAITTGFMGQAPTPMLGEQAMQETMGLIGSHADVFERRMRAAGKLGKDERLRDKWGRVRGDKMFDVLEFAQKDIPRFYGAKNAEDTIDRVARTGMMSAQGIAGLMNLDVGAMRKAAAAGGTAAPMTAEYMKTEAGRRAAAEARKEEKDVSLGEKFLGAQDKAVEMGGGAAGIAIASAGEVFSKGAQTFWNAVEIFAASAGGSAVKAATGAVVGAGAGTAATATAAGVASRVIAAAGVPGLVVGGLTMAGDVPERYQVPATESENAAALRQRIAKEKSHLADVRKGGASGWVAETFFGGGERETTARISELQKELAKAGGGIDATGADLIGASVAKHLSQKTLRTQDAGQVQPAGQGQAL